MNWVKQAVPGANVVFSLDNEPDLWASTHAEVHPSAVGYTELANRNIAGGGLLPSYSVGNIGYDTTTDSHWCITYSYRSGLVLGGTNVYAERVGFTGGTVGAAPADSTARDRMTPTIASPRCRAASTVSSVWLMVPSEARATIRSGRASWRAKSAIDSG
mgnify:CR=1 FL=1